jgi:hypothetical protein
MPENTETKTPFDPEPVLWPFNRNTDIIDRDLARSIRAWALTCMTEAELRSYSQRQLLMMHVDHCGSLLEKVLGPSTQSPEDAEGLKDPNNG